MQYAILELAVYVNPIVDSWWMGMSVYKTIIFVCDWCGRSVLVSYEDKRIKINEPSLPLGWSTLQSDDTVLCPACVAAAGFELDLAKK